MNERIRELAEQADQFADGKAQIYHPDWRQFRDEKFAELILTEVISTIYRSDISDKKQEKLVDELAYKFGMK